VINPLQTFGAILPVYLIMVVGMVARWVRVMPVEADVGFMRLVIWVLLPALTLDKMLGNPLVGDVGAVATSAGLGFLIISLGIGVSLFGGRLIGLDRGDGLRTFALTTGVQNYGFVALPVMFVLFPGSDSLGLLFTHGLGVELAIWSVGLMVLTGGRGSMSRALVNGPVLAVLLGLTLVWSGAERAIPEVVHGSLGLIGACAIPMALLLVGTTIADMLFGARVSAKLTVAAIVIRLGVLTVMILALAKFLPLPVALKEILLVQAAMPSAVFPVVMARHYGGSSGVGVRVIVATTLASLVTMPLVLSFGSRWLGL